MRVILLLVVGSFFAFALSYLARIVFEPTPPATLAAPPSAPPPEELLPAERNTIEVFQNASPGVVFVHNLQHYRRLFSFEVEEVQQGAGSGFLWDRRGHIVTNFHVVRGADRIAVTLVDGNTYRATVVGVEPRKDLAVLRIKLEETNVTPYSERLADSSKLLVGQKAMAIGNPFGLDHTLTVGSVSAIGRSMPSVVEGVTIRDMVQTDASINPGNSGGPLLDSQGNLIGMNTLILRHSTGIGFAVPSNTIRRIVGQIIRYGQPVQAGVGVTVFEDRVSATLGVEGVVVREVQPGTPAAKAGLRGTTRDRYGRIRLGDIIVSIDGQPVRNYDDLYNAFDKKKPGDRVAITYKREGETRTIELETINVTS